MNLIGSGNQLVTNAILRVAKRKKEIKNAKILKGRENSENCTEDNGNSLIRVKYKTDYFLLRLSLHGNISRNIFETKFNLY